MSRLDHWTEEGATAEERTLIEASRQERPNALLHARVMAAVARGGAEPATSKPLRAASAGTATKLAVVAALVGAIGGSAAWRIRHVSSLSPTMGPTPAALQAIDESPTARAAPVLPEPSSAPAPAPPPVTAVPDPRPEGPPSARSVASALHARSSDSSLQQEVAALEKARRALPTAPERALALLDDYRARFPKGALRDEATVLRIQGLLADGDRDQANALADSFVRSHPDNPYARRARALLHRDAE